MRIIVSDSSCLIDLRKASLLEAFLNLPYEIIIPDTLFKEELLKFSDAQKNFLAYLGTESRPGSRPEQIEKRNGKKPEGGPTRGQQRSDSDSTTASGSQAAYLKRVAQELRPLASQQGGNRADNLKDGFQGEGFPTAAVYPNFEVTEEQRQFAREVAALNILPIERLSRYLDGTIPIDCGPLTRE